jgi:thiamine-phosphate pyrophosphorylase
MIVSPHNRCRLVLAVPEGASPARSLAQLGDALTGGDVASVIVVPHSADEKEDIRLTGKLAEIAHERDVALIVSGEPRIAVRSGADGVHLEVPPAELAETVERHQGTIMVGAGGARTRHAALELGEARPDYLFFGRLGYDTQPVPHPRNLSLGGWWSQMVELPCIVQGGADWRSASMVAETGAEFVALSAAVFGSNDCARRVADINALLDESAPRWGD